MRKQWLVVAVLLSVVGLWFGARTEAAAEGDQYVGTWNGTWEGAGGMGRFDLTLERGAGGAITGGVSVTDTSGDYTAKFTSLSFVGNKMTGKYDYTPNPMAELTVTATFTAGGATGTWVLGAKGQDGAPMANGTWTVKKK